jgi:hypothetical protein
MRTKRAIENQLKHFRNGCPKAGTEENETWIKALEWVLVDDPAVAAEDLGREDHRQQGGQPREACATADRIAKAIRGSSPGEPVG